MRSKQIFVAMMFVLATGCVAERGSGEGKGDDAGSGSGSAVDPNWLPGATGRLATDATHLYFSSNSRLQRVPLAGGPPETLYTWTAPQDGSLLDVTGIYPGPSDVVVTTSLLKLDLSETRTMLAIPKAGGAARELSTSQDSRSYLGLTFADADVYFSSFTSLLRMPIAGGDIKFVGESPNSVQYWVFSPTIVGADLFWAEGNGLYRIPASSLSGEGTLVAQLPGSPSIIGTTASSFVVSLAQQLYGSPTQVAVVDRTTGQISPPLPIGDRADEAVVVGDAVYAATFSGVRRVPLDGSPAEQLTTEGSLYLTASSDAVFVSGQTGITRIAL